VAAETARHLNGPTLVVTKSTVPVGSGDLVREIIAEHAPAGAAFEVASNPEFLREGSAIDDSLLPDRIVIGCRDRKSVTGLLELYAPLERPILLMDIRSAELVKQASNSFLATRISFINCMADLCEETGADIAQVVKGMGADRRIGRDFLSPGLGYGGSCFPKDTAALAAASETAGCPFELLDAVTRVNQERVPRFVRRMRTVLGDLRDRTVGVLGLAFKPNTDDIRESKAIELVRALVAEGAHIRAYDPAAGAEAGHLLTDVTLCKSAYDAARGSDAIVVATEWNEFKLLDLQRLRQELRQAVVFDGRNVYSPDRMAEGGFLYISVGRQDTGVRADG
jgi:UDPglucose 6-dehydrogenase